MSDPVVASACASVHSIDHFALNVPSLADAERFFGAFGLDVAAAAAELELACGRWSSLGAHLPRVEKVAGVSEFQLLRTGFRSDPRSGDGGGRRTGRASRSRRCPGFWFRDPDGNLIQVKIGPKTTPVIKEPCVVASSHADERGAHMRSAAKTVRPRRLSHVLLFSPDVLGALDFYGKALGLRLSDKSLDIIAFTHAPHGSDHHLVAFAKSSARGWHHAAWDVDNVNLVGQGASQMAAAGFTKGWGTGRHVLGSNYFHYVQDPWGSFCEYSADIDFVSAGQAWPAGDFAPEDSLYLWGPPVPDDFIHNTEAGVVSED